ncbi:MAG: hypothetical protein J6V83_01190 [Clostridia bacterium]|nr:hypothetical protein [Clostridia bacterium]
MKKVLKTLLYIIGFPALLALVVYNSLYVIEEGSTYGFWPFIGTIIAAVCLLVYTIVFIVTGKNSKKNRGNRKKVMKSVATLVIIAFVLTAGIWLVIDIPMVLPDILNTATSGTLGFDDGREDYNSLATVHGKLLDDWIGWNVDNGNLSEDLHTREEWLELGYSAPEVQELIAHNFKSMDQNGYATFTSNGPWLNLANDNRLTIPVLVHLLLNERKFNEELTFTLVADVTPNLVKTDAEGDNMDYNDAVVRDEDKQEVAVHWTILDMQGGNMKINLDSVMADPTVKGIIDLLTVTMQPILESILTSVKDVISDPNVAGSEIYIGLDATEGGLDLVLTSAVQSRGMHGYQYSAWLNSNNLLFAVISIFPARQWLYIWGGMVIFASLAVGALRLKEFGGKKEEDPEDEDDDAEDDQPIVAKNPYEKAFLTAQRARNKM